MYNKCMGLNKYFIPGFWMWFVVLVSAALFLFVFQSSSFAQGTPISTPISFDGPYKKTSDTFLINFSSAVTKSDGNPIGASDIQSFVTFETGTPNDPTESKDKVPFSGFINSARTQITITPTAGFLADGEYTLSVITNTVRDSSGSLLTGYFQTYLIDTVVPKVVFSPENGAVILGTKKITLSFDKKMHTTALGTFPIDQKNAHTVVTFKKDGSPDYHATRENTSFNPNTITITPGRSLTDGIYTVTLSGAYDIVGNTPTPLAATFTIKTMLPTLDLAEATDNITKNSTPTITVGGLSDGDASAKVALAARHEDGTVETAQRTGNGDITLPTLKGGTWVVTAVATDVNRASRTANAVPLVFIVDTEDPARGGSIDPISGDNILTNAEDESDVIVTGMVPRGTQSLDISVQGDSTVSKDDITNFQSTFHPKINTLLPTLSISRNDEFSTSIAVWEDTLFVGAPGDSSATGAVYIFKDTDNDGWQNDSPTKIENDPNGLSLQNGDKFGTSIAVWEDTLFVGAPGDSSATGAVYIFKGTNNGGWLNDSPAKIKGGTNGLSLQKGYIFGTSLAVWGDTLFVGMIPPSTSGAVYIFKDTDNDGWLNDSPTKLERGRDGDYFGTSIAVWEDTLLVGARGDSSTKGAVYIFKDTNNDGLYNDSHTKIENDPNGLSLQNGDMFGTSIAVWENTLLVGAPGDSSATGAVYIFKGTNNGGWLNDSPKKIENGTDGLFLQRLGNFGTSLAIWGDTRLIGSNTRNGTVFRGDQSFSVTLTSDEVKSLFASVTDINKEVRVTVIATDTAGATTTLQKAFTYKTIVSIVAPSDTHSPHHNLRSYKR